MIVNKVIIILIIIFSPSNAFSDDIISLYQICLQDLDNYNTIGYKAHLFYNGGNEINFNAGLIKNTDGLFDFMILGKGFFCVEKKDKYYYTRKGDFYYDFEKRKIVNHDGYALVLKNRVNIDAIREDVRLDVAINTQLFDIDVQRCKTVDNIYFEDEAKPGIDHESRVIFGCLENSNVSAFYSLLMMRYIIYENIDYIENSVFLLETINMLISKLNTDEHIGRDENWILIKLWIPYLKILMSTN